MCIGAKSPKIPDPPAPAPVSGDVPDEVKRARDRTKQQALAAGGRSGTILTGPGGATTPAPVGFKTLLGQ